MRYFCPVRGISMLTMKSCIARKELADDPNWDIEFSDCACCPGPVDRLFPPLTTFAEMESTLDRLEAAA